MSANNYNLTYKAARKIIHYVINSSMGDNSIVTPESESDCISLANDILSQAIAAQSALTQPKKEVEEIIQIYNVSKLGGDTAIGPYVVDTLEEKIIEEAKKDQPDLDKFDGNNALEKIASSEGLPIPSNFEGNVEEIPLDLTQLPDLELRRLYSAYNAYHLRAAWLAGVEDSFVRDCETAKSIHLTNAIAKVSKVDDNGKQRTVTSIRDEARGNPVYAKWNQRYSEHYNTYKSFHALEMIYDKACERLSREWTMRSSNNG